MTSLSLNILGFPAVNRDLTVELRDPVSAAVVRTAQPFLDGTLRVPNLAAGAYEMTVLHPNLTLPVIRRPIRVLPTGETKVSVLIDPTLFRNTPIEDIPDANLGPVRQRLESTAETLVPLGNKLPGESIRAEDWNAMADAIRDIALSVGELTRLVTPTGHDHPEFITKFSEVTTNFDTLINSLGAAMTELQRQIQAQRFRRQVEDVLSAAEIAPNTPEASKFTRLVDQLEQNVTLGPALFSRTARDVGVQLQTNLEQLIDQRGVDPEFVALPAVQSLSQSTDILKGQRTTSYGSELELHRKTDRTFGAGGLKSFR